MNEKVKTGLCLVSLVVSVAFAVNPDNTPLAVVATTLLVVLGYLVGILKEENRNYLKVILSSIALVVLGAFSEKSIIARLLTGFPILILILVADKASTYDRIVKTSREWSKDMSAKNVGKALLVLLILLPGIKASALSNYITVEYHDRPTEVDYISYFQGAKVNYTIYECFKYYRKDGYLVVANSMPVVTKFGYHEEVIKYDGTLWYTPSPGTTTCIRYYKLVTPTTTITSEPHYIYNTP